MTETLSKKTRTIKTVKTVSSDTIVNKQQNDKQKNETVTDTSKSSIIPPTRIKKVFDELSINKNIITVINKIKLAIKDNVDVTTILTEDEQQVVGKYYEINKEKIDEEKKKAKEKARENGTVFKPLSLNEMSLRVYMGLKYKLKKDLTIYLSIICDLIVEEIIKSTIKSIEENKKKSLDTKFINSENLSNELLYPLYNTLPSFKQLMITQSVTEENENDEEVENNETVEENEDDKLYDIFKGSVRKIYLKIDTNKDLKVRKTYLEFLSKLIVEFLERLEKLLIILVKNTSKNRVIIKEFGTTLIELLMSDYSVDVSNNSYSELYKRITERLN
jgi:hypothetical protein